MIHEFRPGDERIAVVTSASHLTVRRGAERVAAFDREGRPFSFWRRGTTWRRGLDGRIQLKRGPDRRRWLVGEAADRATEAWAREARKALEAANSGGLPAGDLETLARASGFDSSAAAADAQRFRRAYGSGSSVSVLPPDAYLSVVVQGTLGCSFNTCTFCDLYRDGRYRVRPAGEFADHVREVGEFMGRSALLRPRVFLGEANALAAPAGRVLAYLEVVARAFPGRPVHAFVDAFIGTRRTPRELAEMRGLGLERVSVGLESGHDPLLEFVRKPGTAADAATIVRSLKDAGIAVNVIVLAGLGGDQFASGHVADTVDLIGKLGLDRRDIVYVSDLQVLPATPYRELAAARGLRGLSAAEVVRRRSGLIGALRQPGGPRVTRYDIREFVY
jgi:radical SAM superfamily enzyme YgiQ (UPF0313 family)